MKPDKLYTLKVALSDDNNIWRRIEILGNQSLDQLHEAIFEAFDRFDPHLYSFYLTRSGSKSMRRFAEAEEFTHPAAIEEDIGFSRKKLHDASKIPLASLGLEEKDRFEYLFDFGDEWIHEITIEKILDLFPEKEYPVISERKGGSPPQYPDFDEDDECEYEEAEKDAFIVKNSIVLAGFRKYLEAKNLSDKTINKHTSNIDFYINEFLLYYEPIEPKEGIRQIGFFLGYWFIRKAMWASVTSIRENITSLKHFYTFLLLERKIKQHELDEMKREIKECKDDWLKTLKQFDDPDIGIDDIW